MTENIGRLLITILFFIASIISGYAVVHQGIRNGNLATHLFLVMGTLLLAAKTILVYAKEKHERTHDRDLRK